MEVLVVYAKKLNNIALEDVIVKQQQNIVNEFKRSFEESYFSENLVGSMSTKRFSKHEQPNLIREALIKGYVEMSHINLTICSECLHAEYEAEHMVERLVSGG